MTQDLLAMARAAGPTPHETELGESEGLDLFAMAGIKPQPKKQPERSFAGTALEAGLDFFKRAGGAAVGGLASVPEAVQSGVRSAVRSGASGDASTAMPGGVFTPGIDTDESINGLTSELERDQQALSAERVAAGVRLPGAAALAKMGKGAQQSINDTTSQATKDAVAGSQVTGNLLKGEIDFGKNPSVRGFVMQGADVFGSMLPVVATALATRSPSAAGAVGGTMAAGEGVGNARDFVAKMSDEELAANSPLYQRMVKAGASAKEARGIVSAKAEDTSALLQGAVAAVGDRFTGKLVTGGLDDLIRRMAGKSVVGRAAAGGAVSSLEEGTQELTEGVASDIGTKSVVSSKEIGEDSAANFVLGALGGGAPGAARGVVARGAEPAAKQMATAPAATSQAAVPADAQTAPEAALTPEQNSAPAQVLQGPAAINSDRSRVLPGQQQPESAPDAMDDRTAAVRLAELEVIDSGVGLNDAQQAERAALAARVEAQAAREAELESIGESAEGDTGNPVSAPALVQSEQAAIESGAPEFDPGAVQAKTWPQFVAERGEKVSTLRRGTPAWDALQNEWAAVKTKRAGVNPEGTGAVGAPAPEIQNRDRSRPASVVQMQGMAQNPDYMRLGVSRSPETGAPMVFAVGDRVQAAQAIGRADTAVMSDGQRVPFQYAVMEAADVQPSNFADGNPNPLFDAGHPGTVKALNNGRTAGLRAAYERGTAEGYKQELMADSAMHGIDAELIAGMKAPVLVRLYSERDNQSNMGAKSQSQALGLSATEQAATDAALLDGAVLDVFDSGDLGSAGNRDFARAFIGKLQVEGQDVAGMLDASGALSPAGVTRLQAALVHKAYSDGDLVESMFGSTDTDIRAIGEALKVVAGEWANMRNAAELGAINPQVDVTGNLLQAIRLVQKARRERASLYDAINQVDMVTGDVVDPITVGMLRMLYSGEYMTRALGRDSVVESLRTYMGAALATRADGDMFGEQVGPDAILSALSGQPTTQTSNATSTEPARQSAPEPAQGERGATGSDPAGRRADEPGRQEQRPQPDKAGPDSDAAGRSGQGQGASDQGGQPDRQGDQGASEDRSGAVAPPPGKPTLRDTRGTGIRLHGTSRPLPGTGPSDGEVYSGNVFNIYGQGFYTTDAADIAAGYTRKGKGGDPTLYEVAEREPVRLYDMDAPMGPEVRAIAEQALGDLARDEDGETGAPITTLSHLFDEARAESRSEGVSADELQDSFYAVRESLEMLGYRGFTHVGGKKTGKAAHQVNIYWFPEGDLSVNRSDLARFEEGRTALELDSYSPEEVTQREAAQRQADEERAREGAKADADARAERERKEVAERMNASADNFELGQDADDSLSGQKPMFSRAPSIETKAFKDWFNGSKVVDAEGKPLVMYHGTAQDFDAFDNSKTGANDMGLWGRGHYFASNPTSANSYALRQGDGARVMPAYVSVQNPLVLQTGGDLVTRLPDGTNTRDLIGENLDGAKIKAIALDGGHDGVIQIKPDGSIGDVVAFRPEQIKSAIGNRGTFDPSSPDIRFSFAGQTARTADLAELQRAKDMAERGVSSAAIQKHTGWHRGVDGRWRFEVSDDKAAFRQSAADESAVREIEKQVRDSATVTDDGDMFRAVVGDGTDGVMTGYGSTRETALQRLADRVARSRFGTDFDIAKVEDRSAYPLSDVLNHPDLLVAYPFLRGFTVYFRKGGEGGVRGSFDERNQAITLDSGRKPQEMLSTLLHELQHAIQAREDFGRGGNASADFSKNVKNVLREMADTEARAVEAWKARHPELMASADKTAAAVRDALKYESMERLLAYSERDKPSGVFRLIRNEMQWIYEHESWRDPVAFELQRRFYGMPKSGPKRNAFIRNLAFDAQQWLRGSIAADNLAAFKSDERTTKGMIAALRRQAEKAQAKLQPLREQERRAQVAEALERQSQFKSSFDIYRSLAGEVEARATQARQQLTPEERRARPVAMDMDVSPSEAIVVVGGQEMLLPESQLSADSPSAGAFDVGSFLGVMQPSDETRSKATAKAQALVDRMTAGWANAPQVVVAFDMADPKVPAAARLDFNAQQSRGAEGTADGFFYGGKVYLIASQLPAENDLRRVLFHESLGHYGLRGVFGDALKPILKQVAQARRQEVHAKAAQYGLDMRKEADRLMAAEEVLAELAEKSPELGFVRRAVAAVRAFMRGRFEHFQNLRVSDDEIIQQYILPARGWVERGRAPAAGGRGAQSFQPAFSIQEDVGGKALEELSKASDLFALPKSEKDTLAGIAAEHPGGITVGAPRSIAGRVEYTLTTLSGKTATVSVREPNPFGDSVYDMKYTDEGMEAVAGRPGENPQDVAPTADVWIDVSDLSPGQADGAAIYNIAATYAHNTGRIFIGDPHGLSKEALRRRLEQMLSSALKFGTTRHLAPHPDQVKGGNGVPGLRWVYGDDVGNVERMIAASVKALDNGFPSSKLIAYDPARGFYRTDTGSAVARGQLAAALGRATAQRRMAHGAGSTGQAGWRTVARAALFRYLQQAVDADAGAGRGRLLDRLSAERARGEGDGSGKAPGVSAFDADQRIFYSRQPGVTAGAPAPKGRLAQLQDRVRSLTSRDSVDTWLYNWQDKFIDLKRIQDQIKALNGTVSETNDAYRGEELYHKRVAKRTSNFLRDEVRPLLKAMNDAKVEMPEFERFLHARHAPEANRVMAERNPNQQQLDQKRMDADKAVHDLRLQLQRARAASTSTAALQKSLGMAMMEADKWSSAEAFRGTEEERLSLSGMSDAEANKIMTSYAPDMRKALDDLAERVDKINNGTLKTLEQYGLMDPATLATWSKTYQHYVPLHRDEANPGSKAHPIGQGFSTKGDASKQRTGSNEKVTHILSHIVMQREAALTRGEKNNVVKRLYLLAAQNPDDNIWSLEMPKKKTVDPDTGLVKTIIDQGAKLCDNVVTLRVGGKDKHIVFNEQNERAVRLALAVKNMDATELDRFTRTMGVLTRWFAAVNTQYNPIFGVMNLARDLQGSMLQLSSTPLAGKQGEVFKNIRSNMGSIYKDLRRERKEAGAGQGPWAKLWEEMQLDGGTTGYRDLYSKPEDRAKALQKALDRNTEGAAMGAARGMLEWLSDFNETLEATTRLATYKAALDNGMSREAAASLAKNITVNFNRKGRNTSVVGSYYAFLNAAIQGNKRMLETLAGPAGRKIMLGGVALGMMSGMAGALIMGGGGADDEWKKIPEFVKERSIIIPLSRQDYVSIPMPLGFHVFPNIGRKLVEFGMHDDPTKNRAGHLLDMGLIALNAYNPLGGADNIMQMLAPTPFDPVVALMENKDWTGREIYKEQRSALDPKPGHAMAKDSTLPPARWVARVVNDATGGNEWQPGKWSPNPDAIEYLFGQFTGGVGRELSKVGNMATSAATGEELAPHQMTLVGRIYGNTRGVNGQSASYYDNLKRINTSMNEAKGRQQQGEDVDTILADVPLASLDGPANQLDKKVSDLVKQRRFIQKGDAPNKRELVKEINKEIEASMYLLNKGVEARLAEVRKR